MPNVKFLKGTQANLAKYLTTGNTAATEGAFYLTSDTNRLYVGKDIGSGTIRAVPVNQGVITVAGVSSLPGTGEQGQFYYATSENVLCVYSGDQWVQINPDNNTFVDDRVTTASYNSTTSTAAISDVIFDNNGAQFTSNWDVIAGAGLDASVTPKYAPAKKFHSGVTYYTKSGNVYTVASVTSGTFNPSTHYEQVGFALTLTPNAYVLTASLDSTNSTDIELKLSNGNTSADSIATIKPGSNVTFGTSGGDVTISAADSKIDTIGIAAKANSGNGFTVSAKDTSGKTATSDFDPIIRVGSTGEFSDTHFIGGTATLPVYSKTQVDNLFKTFNAMEWRGVVTDGNVPTTNIKNGYVFMAGTGGLSSPVTAKAGDLLIATGTEGSDGYIPSANITWQVVDAGNDTQDVYTVENITHGIAIKKNGGNIGGLEVKADTTYLTVGDSNGTYAAQGGNSKIVTVNHKELHGSAVTNTAPTEGTTDTPTGAISQTSQSGLNITVPSVSYDKAGHITGYSTATYHVVDTHASITNHTIGATVAGNTATIKDTFKVDGASKDAQFTLGSSSLTLAASDGNLTVNLEWGTFN